MPLFRSSCSWCLEMPAVRTSTGPRKPFRVFLPSLLVIHTRSLLADRFLQAPPFLTGPSRQLSNQPIASRIHIRYRACVPLGPRLFQCLSWFSRSSLRPLEQSRQPFPRVLSLH